MLENIIEVIGEVCPGDYTASFITKMLSWLKSLRPSWKPSEEQISALERATVKMHTPNDIGILAELRRYENI